MYLQASISPSLTLARIRIYTYIRVRVSRSNILLHVTPDGSRVVKLADFGVSRILHEASMASTVRGLESQRNYYNFIVYSQRVMFRRVPRIETTAAR